MEKQERLVVMVPAVVKQRFTRAVKSRGMSITFVLRNLINSWEADNRIGPGRPPKKMAGF